MDVLIQQPCIRHGRERRVCEQHNEVLLDHDISTEIVSEMHVNSDAPWCWCGPEPLYAEREPNVRIVFIHRSWRAVVGPDYERAEWS